VVGELKYSLEKEKNSKKILIGFYKNNILKNSQ
jgi:hypothetical protein